MNVIAFSATVLVLAIAWPLHAQGIEVFGGYSANADYVPTPKGGSIFVPRRTSESGRITVA